MRNRYPEKQAGFTLVELLTVIVVIGILAALAITALNPQSFLKKARDAQRKSDLKKIQAAVEQFRADNGYYPYAQFNNHLNKFDVPIGAEHPDCGWPLTHPTTQNPDDPSECDPSTPGCFVYLKSMPCDPLTHFAYDYDALSQDPADLYVLGACLENPDDSQKDTTNLNNGGPPPYANGQYCQATGFPGPSYTTYSLTNP